MILGFIDIEANYLVIKAYQYTTLTSVQVGYTPANVYECVFVRVLIRGYRFQGHVYNSTSRIRNREEKRSWLGFAQVLTLFYERFS